jgi:hypothetical protein
MVTLEGLIRNGYFPKELPPQFTTSSLADNLTKVKDKISQKSESSQIPETTKCSSYSIQRSKSSRRYLKIPNPQNQIKLCEYLVDIWTDVDAHFSKSKLSLSRPIIDVSNKRAVISEVSGYYLPSKRVLFSTGCRYQLFADISNYYPSIYTHTIPWAYHGKDIAKDKANRNKLSMLGNMLDKLIQSMQEDQTVGLPIGPDTSLIISEIILSAVDMEITKLPYLRGFRFYDDFYLYFTNKQEAENALAALNVALRRYELETNPRKTEISEVPISVDSKWKPELSLYRFRKGASAQYTDIMNFFNRALEYHRLYPEERVLKYALRRIMKLKVEKENFLLYESFILQSILIDPDTLSVAVNILFTYLLNEDYTLNTKDISRTINELIKYYIKLDYNNELAWHYGYAKT